MKTKIILISLVMVCLFGFIGSAAWQPRAFSVKGASTTAASNGNAASALVNTFNPILYSDPLRNWASEANTFLNGSYVGCRFSMPMNWDLPGITNPSLRYRIHGMLWLESLLWQYSKTGDPRYPQAALPYIFDYIRKYPVMADGQPDKVWHDDATARRTYALLQVYNQWNGLLTDSQKKQLAKYLKYHANLLYKNSFYKKRHNHGLFQDRSLIYFTLIFPADKDNAKYVQKVKTRVTDYATHMIMKDGSGGEHSPSYFEAVAMLFQDFSDIFKYIDKTFSAQLSGYVKKMAPLIIQIVQPDGTFPQIGDTSRYLRNLNRFYGKMSEYQYVYTKGRTGKAPKATNVVFPTGGYAIFRKDWSMNGTSDYVLFTAAAHGRAHKHYDDLNYIIYHGGDLISEAGTGGYDYGDPLVNYGYSPWAHNVMIANWDDPKLAKRYKGQPVMDASALKTRLTGWSIKDPAVYAKGVQQCIPGIAQARKLTWDKASNVVTIADTVAADKKGNKYLFFMHLAKGVTLWKAENGYYLVRDHKKVALVQFASSQRFTIAQGFGNEKSPIRGWDLGSKSKAWVLAVRFNNAPTNLTFTTTVKLLPLGK